MSPEDSVNVLLGWCDAHGIIIDERIRVVRGDEGDITVFSATDAVIERGTTLVTIPKSCILSIKSCALSDFITPVIYGREAQLGLAIGVYGELLKGNTSYWAGYLHSLPEAVDLAYFWTDEDGDEDARSAHGWIKGTMAERELQGRCVSSRSYAKSSKYMKDLSIRDDFRRYYDTVAQFSLAKAGLGQLATFQGYKHAFALVSSRAFFVDAYHGLAMVPIADAFNHYLENQVHLESDYDVCPACGSLMECPHDTEDDNDSEDDRILPIQLRTRRLDPAGGAPKLSQVDTENTCEMVTNAPVVPFAEVWNTYGEALTNAELLVRYGFLLDSNENDVIAWDPRDLRGFLSGALGEEQRIRNSGTSCEEGVDMCNNDCHAHVRRGPSLQYQSLDDIGGKRDQNIREAHRSPKTGLNDDRHLSSVPGSSTSRPHLATLVNSSGAESSLLNTDLSAAQSILEHLDDLIFLWHCGSSDIWGSSSLVYDPFSRDGDERHDAAHCVHRRRRCGEEAEDLSSTMAVPVPATSADLLTPSELRGEEASKLKAFDGAPALDAHTNEKQAHVSRPQYEDPKCLFALNDEAKISHHLWLFCVLLALDRFTESPETINRESRTATGGTATLRGSNSIGRDRSVAIGGPEAQRCREVAASEESGSSSLFAAVSAQNLQSLVMRYSDPQIQAYAKSKSRHVDLALLERVARAQVQLEELCEALVLEEEEEEGEDDGDEADTSSGKRERRRWMPECFSERRVGSVEAEATRVCTANRLQFELKADDDSRHTRHTHDANKDTDVSAINAIKRYGDSEDDEDEEMGQVAVEKFETANDSSAFAAGTGIHTIAHEHQGARRRDDSHGEGRPTIGIFAGNRSSVTDEDEWSNCSASRVRKRRRRVSPAPAPMSSSNTLQLANDSEGIVGVVVSEICMENESLPSVIERLIPHYAGTDDSVHVPRYERYKESEPGTDADGVHAINLRMAREDLAPPPSSSRLRLHSPCLDLGKGDEGAGRARGLASPGRDYDRVGVVASDIGGASRNESRVQFNACPRLGAENSVSDMGPGNRARILPVAFGVRLGSGLDVDAGGHESDDDQHHARKPEANPASARVAISPYPVGAETSVDATCIPAGVSAVQLNYADKYLAGSAGDPSPVDSLAFVDIVASIAQVVTALCKHRLRSMCNPGMEARELGELADGIPPECNKTRLAAQLALAERSLLESWGAAWAEFGRKLESLRVTTHQGQAEHDSRR